MKKQKNNESTTRRRRLSMAYSAKTDEINYERDDEIESFLKLESNLVDETLSLHQWWSLNKNKYPNMFKLANNISFIQMSQVSSESSFSYSNLVTR